MAVLRLGQPRSPIDSVPLRDGMITHGLSEQSVIFDQQNAHRFLIVIRHRLMHQADDKLNAIAQGVQVDVSLVAHFPG